MYGNRETPIFSLFFTPNLFAMKRRSYLFLATLLLLPLASFGQLSFSLDAGFSQRFAEERFSTGGIGLGLQATPLPLAPWTGIEVGAVYSQSATTMKSSFEPDRWCTHQVNGYGGYMAGIVDVVGFFDSDQDNLYFYGLRPICELGAGAWYLDKSASVGGFIRLGAEFLIPATNLSWRIVGYLPMGGGNPMQGTVGAGISLHPFLPSG